ncbi:MAG: MFS transporter [Verrucomicrobia bacterium]|nr:MFS transporter [Verrucomicrobiota bacterium]
MGEKVTGRALVWSNLLSEPLFTLYGFVSFILYKDLGASAFLISLVTVLKPVVTILSFYWRAGGLRSNVVWSGFLMRAPFLLCFWFDSAWYLAAATVNYMFFYRAGIPAWVEILKRNMPKGRDRAFSMSSALGYAEGVILSLGVGGMLDRDPGMWKLLFVGAAAVGLVGLWVQSRIPLADEGRMERRGGWELISRPWKDSWRLIRERPDFARFQWGFMLCGFGIMLIQPALPIFAVDDLKISYLEMAVAVSIAKGLGFVVSSPLWATFMDRATVHRVSSWVFLTVGLFPVMLALSVWNGWWFYAAYFWYGVGQGGSHLVWNMSGPIFAGKEDSSRYTGVNVVLAGLRGAVGPTLGGWLAVVLGPIPVLVIGALLCFYSGARLVKSRFSTVPS